MSKATRASTSVTLSSELAERLRRRAARLQLPERTYVGILLRNDWLCPVPLRRAAPAPSRWVKEKFTLNDLPRGLLSRLAPRLAPLDLTLSGYVAQVVEHDLTQAETPLVVRLRPE